MTVLNMDCVEGMRLFPDGFFDSIVCDPPYELGFMGKSWDASGVAYSVEMWREALRVLKPGGHLLAFSGSRTYHRMTCAIEDAGFEVRDQIMWVYGSGFPKSLDVSKAIDKAGGDALAWRTFSAAYAAAVEASSLTHSDVDRALGIKSSSCYWARTDHRGGMPPRPHWEQVRALLALPADFARLYDEAEREVVGEKSSGLSGGSGTTVGKFTDSRNERGMVDITAPATPAAQQWQGWGTALKPAHEPICVARKPLIGTVAANVLQHGTGAINVDGCRVGDEGGTSKAGMPAGAPTQNAFGDGLNTAQFDQTVPGLGRWPANLIHDGSDGVLAAFPGEAHRFYYAAKCSVKDRNEGLEAFAPATTSDGPAVAADNAYQRGATMRANTHPTVKPTDLMRYLVRLVTPPGGTVMDPFTGSGSTGKAAVLEGFGFIGFELSAEYAAIATARIEAARK